jgi:hypothetical protein
MRVLVVTPFPIFPAIHGGRVRAWGIARGLARAGAEVDIVCPWTPSLRSLRRSLNGVRVHGHMLAASLLPLLLGDRLLSPLVMLSWQPFAAGPRRLLTRFRGCDIAQFHFCATAKWMGREPRGARVVYVAHNVERDFHYAARGTRGLAAVERLEARAVAMSHLIVTCTAADAARLRTLHRTVSPVAVIQQASDVRPRADPDARAAARRRLGISDDELVLLFVGGPAAHNREALVHLERDVVPHVRRPVRLLAVGRAAPARRENRQSRTLHLGFVEDLSPVLAAADLGVNPVARGSGANCKVALYIGAGLPVLTTPVGLRGYEHVQPSCIVAEVARFAEKIDEFPLAGAPAASAIPAHGWDHAGRQLFAEYQSLLSRGRQSAIEVATR